MEESKLTLIFFDLETTGLNPDSDEVIEIGAIKVRNGEIVEKFHSFVRPHRNIPSLVTNLTGITFEDVENAPPADEIRRKLERFIEECPLIAHNVSFDRIFLEKFMGKSLKNEFFDTLELSRIFFPQFSSHSLQNLVKTLSLKKEEAHRAMSDTLMLYHLFQKIADERKLSSPYLLHRIKEISEPIRHYELIFGDNWEKRGADEEEFVWSPLEYKNSKVNTLPFNEDLTEKPEQYFSKYVYIQKDLDSNFLSEIVSSSRNKKLTISLYDPFLKDTIIKLAGDMGIKAYSIGNLSKFVCPKEVDHILSNLDLIPNNLKMNFATFFSYLYKTRDFGLFNAPTHVVKNPLLKLLSFCNSKFEDCAHKNICPLYDAVKKAKESQLLIVNHSFFFNSTNLNYNFLFRNTVFLNAYRIIKSFYSSKVGFSLNDFMFFAAYYRLDLSTVNKIRDIFRKLDEKRIGDDVEPAVLELRTIFSRFDNPLLNSLFSNEYFWLERRKDRPMIFTANTRVKSVFSSIKNKVERCSFVLPALGVGNQNNVLKNFTGIDGADLVSTKKLNGKFMSVVPMFLHSPNREEFINEFVHLFGKVYTKGNKAVMFFSSNETMKKVYFLLRRNGEKVKAKGIDLKGETGEIELYLYDTPVSTVHADEAYFIRLPNISSVSYNKETFNVYSTFILKNISLEILKNNARALIFYFDGRFKTPSFRDKFEDVFVSFPLFVDREESLLAILSNWHNTNA